MPKAWRNTEEGLDRGPGPAESAEKLREDEAAAEMDAIKFTGSDKKTPE